jgi:pentatricopeptide repeat domain-containing protein 1
MRAEGLTPDTTSFGTALSACERARNWQAARTVLDEARAAEAADIECFNSAISAVARGQGWKAALALLREAEVAGLPPTARSYGPVLLAARRQPKVVAKLVQDEIRPRGLRLGPFSGSAVISAFGAAKQWRAAVGALELIEEPNAACFTAAAAACGRSRQSSAALELLDRMEAVGVVPDGRALQTIAWAAARGGEYAASLATLRRLRTSDGRPLAPADSLGVALSVCESMEAIFELIRAAEASGLAVDPLTLYQVVLEGWAAGAEGTAQSPVAAAASLLRGLGDGSLPAHGDVRALNLLAEVATYSDLEDDEEYEDEEDEDEDEEDEEADADEEEVVLEGAGDRDEALDAMIEAADDADEALDDVEAELGSRYDDDEEDEEEDAFVDNDDGGEGFAFEEDDDEGGGELWLLPVAHVEALLDRAYAKMVTAGQLSPWTAEAMLDLHGYSVALAGAAIRYVLRTLAHEHAERAALGAVDGGRCADGLVVITGRGRGSGEEGPQLGSAVLELLAHGLDPPIEARVLAGNEGRVNLDGESLQRWLKEGGRVLPKEIIE